MEQLNNTTSERVDDLPVIIHWLSQMQIQLSIDRELPTPHGNRLGLSNGQLAVLFLTYILTQADHRLCAVESWGKARRRHRQRRRLGIAQTFKARTVVSSSRSVFINDLSKAVEAGITNS